MIELVRRSVEWTVRSSFRVDTYPDAFEKLAVIDRHRRLGSFFQHKITQELRNHPLLFIHVPKNGGTSIKRALYVEDPGHSTIRFYDWLDPALLRRMVSFALIREPLDRFLSGFDFLMNGGGSDVSIHPAARRRLASIRTIDDFLHYLSSIGEDWFKVDTFARPQWWYLAERKGTIAVDHLWVIGQHEREIANMLQSRGFGIPQHANRTRRSALKLTAAQRAIVERIYAPDFALHAAVSANPGAGRAALESITVPPV